MFMPRCKCQPISVHTLRLISQEFFSVKQRAHVNTATFGSDLARAHKCLNAWVAESTSTMNYYDETFPDDDDKRVFESLLRDTWRNRDELVEAIIGMKHNDPRYCNLELSGVVFFLLDWKSPI